MTIMLLAIGIAAILWGIIIYVITRFGGDSFYGYGEMDDGEDGGGGGKKKPSPPKIPEGGPEGPKDPMDDELNTMLEAIGKTIQEEEEKKRKDAVPYSYCEWKVNGGKNGKKKMDHI